MTLVFHLNELGSHSYSVRFTPHTAFEHILHSQFTAYLVQSLLTILVVHNRGSRDHAEALRIETSELGDHFFRKAVAKILLRGVSGEVLERKNGQHQPLTGCLRPSR